MTMVLDGISWRFKLVDDISVISAADCNNYSTALQRGTKLFLDETFCEELRCGKLTLVYGKPLRIHATGAVDQFRPITDCSRPYYGFLNSYIKFSPVSFHSTDNVILVSRPGYFYAVVDIRSSYRLVPVFLEHRVLQGLRWTFNGEEPNYYVDFFSMFWSCQRPAYIWADFSRYRALYAKAKLFSGVILGRLFTHLRLWRCLPACSAVIIRAHTWFGFRSKIWKTGVTYNARPIFRFDNWSGFTENWLPKEKL